MVKGEPNSWAQNHDTNGQFFWQMAQRLMTRQKWPQIMRNHVETDAQHLQVCVRKDVGGGH